MRSMENTASYLIKVSSRRHKPISAETLQTIHNEFKKRGIPNITIDAAWLK